MEVRGLCIYDSAVDVHLSVNLDQSFSIKTFSSRTTESAPIKSITLSPSLRESFFIAQINLPNSPFIENIE